MLKEEGFTGEELRKKMETERKEMENDKKNYEEHAEKVMNHIIHVLLYPSFNPLQWLFSLPARVENNWEVFSNSFDETKDVDNSGNGTNENGVEQPEAAHVDNTAGQREDELSTAKQEEH